MNKNPLREPISAATKILQMEPQNETHKKKKKPWKSTFKKTDPEKRNNTVWGPCSLFSFGKTNADLKIDPPRPLTRLRTELTLSASSVQRSSWVQLTTCLGEDDGEGGGGWYPW